MCPQFKTELPEILARLKIIIIKGGVLMKTTNAIYINKGINEYTNTISKFIKITNIISKKKQAKLHIACDGYFGDPSPKISWY